MNHTHIIHNYEIMRGDAVQIWATTPAPRPGKGMGGPIVGDPHVVGIERGMVISRKADWITIRVEAGEAIDWYLTGVRR